MPGGVTSDCIIPQTLGGGVCHVPVTVPLYVINVMSAQTLIIPQLSIVRLIY